MNYIWSLKTVFTVTVSVEVPLAMQDCNFPLFLTSLHMILHFDFPFSSSITAKVLNGKPIPY